MQLFLRGVWIAVLAAVGSCSVGAAPVPIIFDTDMGNDVDDALALAMLHTLADRGECQLLGVTLTNAHPQAVPYVRMLNAYYGRPSVPVGPALRAIPNGDKDNYLSAGLRGAAAVPPAGKEESSVRLLRRLLAQSNQPVAIVQVGFSTNLAALLRSTGDDLSPLNGRELVCAKVSLLSTMAGNFVEATPEYNVKLDIAAAKELADLWPSPIVYSGFEIGRALRYPAGSIEKDFRYAAWHPVEVSYRAYNKMPYDRPTWDLTSVLYAVRPESGYFAVSEAGRVTVDAATGSTRFTPTPGGATELGRHRYLRLDPTQRARVLEALVLLVSQPPANGSKHAK